MATELKYGETVILSAFEIEQHQLVEAEKGYIELLTVKKSQKEYVYIIHEVCFLSKRGCFVECDSFTKAENIFKIATGNNFSAEWFNLARNMTMVNKNVLYGYPRQPWFYSEDIKIFENKFIPSYLT